MMHLKYLKYFLLIFILTSCGFKLANLKNDYVISKITTSGDNRSGYKLKNKVLMTSVKGGKNEIELHIDTKINKSIKEKNISNQISKYEINVVTKVQYKSIKDEIIGTFTLSKTGDYNVSNSYSEMINKEKNLINSLINETSEDIVENLVFKFNDT